MPAKKSFESITMKIESEALKQIKELSEKIDEKLRPNEFIKERIYEELNRIRRYLMDVENSLDTIEEILELN